MDEVLTDRAGGCRACIVNADHPAGEGSIIETIGQVGHRVAAHRLRRRRGTRHDDARHGCGMGDGVIGIGNGQVPHSVVRYRVVDIRYIDTADTACRRGGGIGGGIHQVGHCIVRDRPPAPTLDAVYGLNVGGGAADGTGLYAARRGRTSDGVVADGGDAPRGGFHNAEEVGGARSPIGRRDSADGVVLTTDRVCTGDRYPVEIRSRCAGGV